MARVSWSLFPRKGASPQLVLLTADPSSDPPASVVASSISVEIDPLEEVSQTFEPKVHFDLTT